METKTIGFLKCRTSYHPFIYCDFITIDLSSSDAYMRQLDKRSLVQIMSWRLFHRKPLSERMMTYHRGYYILISYLYDVFSVSRIWMALIRICFVWDWRWHSAGNCQWQIPATSNERILEITALNHIILRANCCQIWKVMDVLCYFPILHVHRNVMWYHESKWYPKVVGN